MTRESRINPEIFYRGVFGWVQNQLDITNFDIPESPESDMIIENGSKSWPLCRMALTPFLYTLSPSDPSNDVLKMNCIGWRGGNLRGDLLAK